MAISEENKFIFNLLPKKTKEEVEREDVRSTGLLYATILLFFTVLVWVGINAIDVFLLGDNVNKWELISSQKDAVISSYQGDRVRNGELVVKTQILSEVVDKHVDPSLVFDIIDEQIKTSTPTVVVDKYGRASDGSFQVSGVAESDEDVSKLIKDFSQRESIENVALLSIASSEGGKYQFTISLILDVTATQ